MQLSRKNHIETRSLTKSFGWNQQDGYQQHDVQEFLRVLFDAIEQSFALAGETNSYINQLYEGMSVSFVKCLECEKESCHDDRFQDLSLPIKNEFGTGVQNSSIEMALENYIKPEELKDQNQYFCEACNKKVDALKGLKISKCPKHIPAH